jgi:hypothetical protein
MGGEEEVLRLPGARLIFATLEGEALVLDFVVGDGTARDGPLTLVTIRARRRRWGRAHVPAPLRRWAGRGTPLDVSVRDRCETRLVRIFGPCSGLAFAVGSVTPELVRTRP